MRLYSDSRATGQSSDLASEHIAPLQDAVDLEIATEEETSLLEAWKKYRVLLNRVNTTTAPDIEWPTVPIIE
ncbi:tail fiber assembly protein [Escherichia coli]|nr:phage tail protein [Escherichia coli]EEW7849131.1 phage tail protein [Escherichia coli]EFC1758981.1 tail fiber assembly protein [Escherichia coli]EFH1069677.1 tail fiber assembly protein [Escherichia coli]EFH4636548.1 phage tail protein [Escherichia coli]